MCSPFAQATIWSPTTRRRCSTPGTNCSTTTVCSRRPSPEAIGKARSISSRVKRFRNTPRPWFPSAGLTTTGRPTACAASHASSTDDTTRPRGTGTPAAASTSFVSCLLTAMPSAIDDVRSVTAVQIRRWRMPWPNCTMLSRPSRRQGMPRAAAARTISIVPGPTQTSSASSVRRSNSGARSGRSPARPRSRIAAASRRQASASTGSWASRTIRNRPVSPACITPRNVVAGGRAWVCSVSAICPSSRGQSSRMDVWSDDSGVNTPKSPRRCGRAASIRAKAAANAAGCGAASRTVAS